MQQLDGYEESRAAQGIREHGQKMSVGADVYEVWVRVRVEG